MQRKSQPSQAFRLTTLLCTSLLALLDPLRSFAADSPEPDGVRLFYRILAEGNNAPFPAKTRSILTIDGEDRTRYTGMANWPCPKNA